MISSPCSQFVAELTGPFNRHMIAIHRRLAHQWIEQFNRSILPAIDHSLSQTTAPFREAIKRFEESPAIQNLPIYVTLRVRDDLRRQNLKSGWLYLDMALGLEPSGIRVEALARILLMEGGWRRIPEGGILRYMRVACEKEARRIESDRETGGKLWNTKEFRVLCEVDMPEGFVLAEMAPYEGPTVEEMIDRKREFTEMNDVLDAYLASGKASNLERRLIRLLLQTGSPADSTRELGVPFSKYQNLQRKLNRRLERSQRVS